MFVHFKGIRHNRLDIHIEVSALVPYHQFPCSSIVFPIPLARLLHMLCQAILKILKPSIVDSSKAFMINKQCIAYHLKLFHTAPP